MKKNFLLNLTLGVATLLFMLWMGRNFYRKMGFEKNQAARAEMRTLLPSLQLEDSAAKVRAKVQAGNFRHLKLDARDASLWIVNTPLELGAKNWSLFLEFDAKSELAAIRLRTPDGTNIRPYDITAPDRVRLKWVSPREGSWNRS